MKIARKMLAASVWAVTLAGSQTALAELEVDDYVLVNATGDNQTADVSVCDNLFTPEGCWSMFYNDKGAGEFSIYDWVSVTHPFTILVGAPDDSLFIDASGNVGVGTSTPGRHSSKLRGKESPPIPLGARVRSRTRPRPRSISTIAVPNGVSLVRSITCARTSDSVSMLTLDSPEGLTTYRYLIRLVPFNLTLCRIV